MARRALQKCLIVGFHIMHSSGVDIGAVANSGLGKPKSHPCGPLPSDSRVGRRPRRLSSSPTPLDMLFHSFWYLELQRTGWYLEAVYLTSSSGKAIPGHHVLTAARISMALTPLVECSRAYVRLNHKIDGMS